MPRTLDLESRRRQVAEAAWSILAKEGPAGLSVRNVAHEAGMPPSSLRYAFPTQASVRDAALALLDEKVKQRTDRTTSQTAGTDGALALLCELLPLDAERLIEIEVLASFTAFAIGDTKLQAATQRINATVLEVCDRAAFIIGKPETGPLIHAAVDGLAFHMLQSPSLREGEFGIKQLRLLIHALGAKEGE